MMDLKRLKRTLTRCMNADKLACKIRYRAGDGEITDRFISPIKFVGDDVVNALCLGRQEPRNFIVNQILQIREVPAAEVMMPAPISVVNQSQSMNVMLDLETLDTRPTGVILSIGAVKFDAKAIIDELEIVVDIQSCLDMGMTVSGDTIAWWMQQSDAARAVFTQDRTPLASSLDQFAEWLGTIATVWGNGPSFDNATLANAYRVCGKTVPWNHRNERCYRTVKALTKGKKQESPIVPHRAIDDARAQAKHLIACIGSDGSV